MVAESVKLNDEFPILPVTFKFKFMLNYEPAILYIIFNTVTSNINKTNSVVASLIKQCYRHCIGTAIFLTLFYL